MTWSNFRRLGDMFQPYFWPAFWVEFYVILALIFFGVIP